MKFEHLVPRQLNKRVCMSIFKTMNLCKLSLPFSWSAHKRYTIRINHQSPQIPTVTATVSKYGCGVGSFTESVGLLLWVSDGTWSCHLHVLSVYQPCCLPIILSCSTIALNNCFPLALPLHHPSSLYLSICVFPMSVLLIPKSPGFYSILFSFFSSICLFGRMPFNQREPASCFCVSQLTYILCHERLSWPGLKI